MNPTFGDRLQVYIAEQGMTARQFSAQIGVAESYMSRVLNNKRRPSGSLLIALAENGADIYWLVTGRKQR